MPDYRLGTAAYVNFFKNCIENAYEEKELSGLSDKLSSKMHHVEEEIARFKQEISTFPLMTLVFLWTEPLSTNRLLVLGEKYLSMMQELLKCGLVPHKDVTIMEFASMDPRLIVDSIRCHAEWPIDKRETFIEFYKEFVSWLSKSTFQMIPEVVDYDREVTRQRKMPFEEYVKFLVNLELRERIMAKVFYLGGALNLEDVLSLKIEDVDYEGLKVNVGGVPIGYPRHLFDDLKAYIKERKAGYIFPGKNRERVNHTIPYRALKAVAIKLGFTPEFTLKDFIKNQ